MSNYWVPSTKWQLVDWLSNRYNESKNKYNKMNKKQLYAIYYSVRNKG